MAIDHVTILQSVLITLVNYFFQSRIIRVNTLVGDADHQGKDVANTGKDVVIGVASDWELQKKCS